MSKSQIIQAKEHIQCGFLKGIPVCFIEKWLRFNDKIKKFNDMKFYPPPLKCPANIFNLWQPFAMEVLTEPYFENEEGKGFILVHINVICNNSDIV